MKCPKCNQELRISKKDSSFGLCDHCRKKFRLPDKLKKETEPEGDGRMYSNIPPKHVREAREKEMRQAYDELLAIGQEEKKSKFSFFKRSN